MCVYLCVFVCACTCSSVYLLKQLAMNKEMEMTLVAHTGDAGVKGGSFIDNGRDREG